MQVAPSGRKDHPESAQHASAGRPGADARWGAAQIAREGAPSGRLTGRATPAASRREAVSAIPGRAADPAPADGADTTPPDVPASGCLRCLSLDARRQASPPAALAALR